MIFLSTSNTDKLWIQVCLYRTEIGSKYIYTYVYTSGGSSSLSSLVSKGGGLVCESVGKADLLSDNFHSKQSREAVDRPLTSHPSPSLTTFAFRSSEVRRLLLDFYPYGGTDENC